VLKQLNRFLFRNFGRHFQYRPRHCHCSSGDCITLNELSSGKEAMITCNNDIKTIERGFYHGKRVTALRNDANDPNIVIAAGDSRYVLDRRVAKLIKVRVV
jgi:Fe2+ transport system protein FeoA